MANWANLPEVVLANIFSYLEILDQYCTSRVCTSWTVSIFRPEVWKSISIGGEKLFLQISCSMLCLDEMMSDVKLCSDLLEFIKGGCQYTRSLKISLLRLFDLSILETVISNCNNLRSVEIAIIPYSREKLDIKVAENIELMLSKNHYLNTVRIYEVPCKFRKERDTTVLMERTHRRIPFGVIHAQHLRELWIVNSLKSHSLSNVMYLINLTELAINPQQLNYSLLEHLASKSLKDLFIVANENTREFYNDAINDKQWRSIAKNGPDLRVHCYFSCTDEWAERETIFKQCMPLASLVYRKNVWLRYPANISKYMITYSETLVEFVDYSLSELTYTSRPINHEAFSSRIDNWIIDVAKYCHKLRWLTVKEPLSSATLLVIACLNRHLSNFLVRDDMIIYKNDIPDNVFCNEYIRNTAQLFCEEPEKLNDKMSELLNITWKPLSKDNYFFILDKKFKRFK